MQIETAYQKFDIASLGNFGFAGLPFDPLALVAVPDNSPRLIIGYDHHAGARIKMDVLRTAPECTHVNVTLLLGVGAAPVCVGFGAACAAMTMRDGKLFPVNPRLRSIDEGLYGILKGLHPLRKMLHPNLRECVTGIIGDEDWRICDSFMSISLNDQQIKDATNVIETWRKNPPEYEIRSTRGKNCSDFVSAVVKGAGIPLPWWACPKPYPGVDAKMIDIIERVRSLSGGKGLAQQDGWWLQSSILTQKLAREMAPERTAQCAPFDKARHVAPAYA